MVQGFWRHYSQLGHSPRLACRELLFEQRSVPRVDGPIPDLRQATLDDLEKIMTINAGRIMSECGIDPLKKDETGFRERLARRIAQGRIWVWIKDQRLIFKADVFAETPEMMYLEGINVGLQGARTRTWTSLYFATWSPALAALESSLSVIKRAEFALRRASSESWL